MSVIWISLLFGLLSIITALFFNWTVKRSPPTAGAESKEQEEKLLEISGAISEGAMAFLTREYRYMAVFMGLFSILIWLLVDWGSALSFLAGASISILSGFIGMKAATMGNVRTTAAANKSLGKAFRMAFDAGAVMGFGLVGLALIGLVVMYLLLTVLMPDASSWHIMEALAGFGLGGSSIALFARVGGGIYTKAADVGADLVGKVEENIPEDDPRNPAVIADNVGDNVGDIAGMGADLFGSVAESTCAALVIGAVAFTQDINALLYPLMITGVGIPIAIFSTIFARAYTERTVETALKRTLMVSTVLMAVAMYFVTVELLPETFSVNGMQYGNMGVYLCVLTGLVAGMLIGVVTEIYTSHRYKPVREVARASETGPATNVIYGLALGYQSSLLPIFFISATVYVGYEFAGMYGIAVSSLGMLGTIAISLTIDAFGPVADNAGGIAEMAGMDKKVRKRTDALDAAGNTTAAIGKGFAIGSAALTALALFSAFLVRSNVDTLNVLKPVVISFLVFGGMLPFVFTAMTMKSVGKAAMDMIKEVRRQFQTIPGLRVNFRYTEESLDALRELGVTQEKIKRMVPLTKEAFSTEEELLENVVRLLGKLRTPIKQEKLAELVNLGVKAGRPDYRRCVDISTQASLREMLAPGAQVILTPIVVGFLFGAEPLAAMLIGSLVSGVVLATSSANSGGGWDNAKKYIEAGALGGKGSSAHAAAVVGDTVGDPFKDTSGPSLNILIKLQAIISLVFAPFFTNYSLHLLG
ncbi:MAG: V-type H(+)-translocating pyrophosphatase [Deltaproteobacteria bacterium]|nr:V-type H(+)-translocating pyrophosphatase [Deltaproteobacteria bacterium]